MAGIADLVDAPPAFYGERWNVVSGTNWEIPAYAYDSNGAAIAWTNCSAVAKFKRRPDSSTAVKTATQTLTNGLQIDLGTAGKVVLRGTPACVFAAEDLNRPLIFNLQITCTSPSLVLIPFQRCFLVPQANLND